MFRHHLQHSQESVHQDLNLTAIYRGADKSLASTRKNTSPEARRGRARFRQHRDASCHQLSLSLKGKSPEEIHVTLTETLAFVFFFQLMKIV